MGQDFFPMGNEEKAVWLAGVFPAEPAIVKSSDNGLARAGRSDDEVAKVLADGPFGGELVKNPVQGPPGFTIGNVFVLAGVPNR